MGRGPSIGRGYAGSCIQTSEKLFLRTWVNKVYAYDLGLLVEDVLDLPERVGREDVSEPQVQCPRVRQGMEDVARYEDGRSRLDGTRFGADLDRAGPCEDKVDLGRTVAVPAQRLAGWHPADAHGERLAAGDVPADEGSPVNQALPRNFFFWPRFPLAGALVDDDRFANHPLTSLSVAVIFGTSIW